MPSGKSEIDDIFSLKNSSKAFSSVPSSSRPSASTPATALQTGAVSNVEEKKKRKKKRKAPVGDATTPDNVSADHVTKVKASTSELKGPKTPAVTPVVVVDSSIAAVEPPKKRQKIKGSTSLEISRSKSTATKVKSKTSRIDDEDFKDSRGTGPRRTTEEGFSVFKEDELKINPESGGTPLCPFDCDCCY
ncbi:DUF1764-domain-containing protein [Sistotremastrum niveocremeum HHB9708]|uniref:DUF1764-domain-containing protein n=1 Tax=Sistotremastrum niveocremeum HHB9708 TaxID=1314777 RepID=A0A164Y1G5_9AGAM|nr:DUF1764-domain-containing protein [Sistotremastrum niveocremeum HHB9708]